jgi:hypothetical protein
MKSVFKTSLISGELQFMGGGPLMSEFPTAEKLKANRE